MIAPERGGEAACIFFMGRGHSRCGPRRSPTDRPALNLRPFASRPMSAWLDRLRRSRARAAIPTIWVAFVLSLAFHAAVLWGWQPRDPEPSLEHAARGKASGPLVLQLAPQPAP